MVRSLGIETKYAEVCQGAYLIEVDSVTEMGKKGPVEDGRTRYVPKQALPRRIVGSPRPTIISDGTAEETRLRIEICCPGADG